VKNSYRVKVNDTFDFEIDQQAVLDLDSLKITDSEFHVLENHKSYKAEITKADFHQKNYTVKVNNNTYNVIIFNKLDALIIDLGFEIGAVKKINEIKAPMPGLILDIHTVVGQEVLVGDALLILEAMKMENVLTSPRDGVIKSISVQKGTSVEKNQLLIEFE